MKKTIFQKASDLPSRRYTPMQKIFGLCLALSVLFALLGCQQTPAGSDNAPAAESSESAGNAENSDSSANTASTETACLPDSGRIAELEALYGQGKEAVLQALEVTEDTESPISARGMWSLKETTALQGVDFSQALLCNAADETLYGLRYWYRTDDPDQAVQLAQGLLEEGRELYGEPTTYPGLSNRLSADSFAADFDAAISSGTMADWKEEWALGENTLCTLSVSVTGPDAATIFLEYSLAV